MWRIETRFEMLARKIIEYHGSDPRFRDIIRSEGLKAQEVLSDPAYSDEMHGPGVWIGSLSIAEEFSNGDIWEVDITGYPQEIDGVGHLYVPHDIPPDRLRLIMADWEPV